MAMGDFEIQKKNLQEKITAAEEEAAITMDMSEVESLNKQMAELEAKKHTFESVSDKAEQGPNPNQEKQIIDNGGSTEELGKRLQEKNEEVKVVEEDLDRKIPRVSADGPGNEEFEPVPPQEEVSQNLNFREQDAEKLESFKDTINAKLSAAKATFLETGDVSVLNKLQVQLEGNIYANTEGEQGAFLKEVDAQIESIKKSSPEKVISEHPDESEMKNLFGNNVLTRAINYETGIVVKNYDDEPTVTYLNIDLDPEKVKEVQSFFEANRKDFEWTWIGSGKVQLKIHK